jgi:hypothetical protein
MSLALRNCLLLALTILGASNAVLADQPPRPGILLGSWETDSIGDSRYTALRFCGEYLFLQTDAGPRLIDPATRKPLPLNAPAEVRQDQYSAGLIDCSLAGGETILWFDTGGDKVVWQTIDGSRSGEVRGFARAKLTRDVPLLDASDTVLTGIAADGQRIEATAMPTGMRLSAVSLEDLAPFLPEQQPTDFKLLSANFIAVESLDNPVAILSANFDFKSTVIRGGVVLQDVVPDGKYLSITEPDAQEGLITFKVKRGKDVQDCSLLYSYRPSSPAVADCTVMPKDNQTFSDRLYQQLGPDAFEWDTSRSRRWVAWDELIGGADPETGGVRFYLAPITDLIAGIYADTTPGRLLGIGYDDPSGDTPYGPLSWCGDRLFLDAYDGQRLIDPSNGAVLWQRDPQQESLFACAGEGAETVFWFDPYETDEITWQSIDGRRSGSLRGFRRGDTTGWPMVLIDGNRLVGLVEAGGKLEASALPDGMRTVALPQNRTPSLTKDDALHSMSVLGPDLLELETFRRGSDTAILMRVDLQDSEAKVEQSWTLEDLLSSTYQQIFDWPKLTPDGDLTFAVVKARVTAGLTVQTCKAAGLGAGAPRVACGPEMLKAGFEPRPCGANCYSVQASESRAWTAWLEEMPPDFPPIGGSGEGDVRLYLAPTADLLKP